VSLLSGKHSLRAVYDGDANFQASTSDPLAFTA
jgi:hypothetical protein